MDGLVVTVDGERLPEHYEVKHIDECGFNRTRREPAQQLALAILFDHLGEAGSGSGPSPTDGSGSSLTCSRFRSASMRPAPPAS